MTIKTAFELFQIDLACSREELTATYRRLVKQYHPDSNRYNTETATKIMSRVNEAYKVAQGFLEAGADQKAQMLHAPPPQPQPEQRQSRVRTARSMRAARDGWQPAIGSQFLPLVDIIVSALYTYYQYGLENVHQQREGFKRMRFRSSQRRLADGIGRLTARIAMENYDNEGMQIFLAFARAFAKNMAIKRYYIPTKDVIETKVYRLYRDASSRLDIAIKQHFCAELIGVRDRLWNGANGMDVIYYELMLILTDHPTSQWFQETKIKMNLFECFQGTLVLFQPRR